MDVILCYQNRGVKHSLLITGYQSKKGEGWAFSELPFARPAARSPHRPSGRTRPSNANPTLPAGPARGPLESSARERRGPGAVAPGDGFPSPRRARPRARRRLHLVPPAARHRLPKPQPPGQSKGRSLTVRAHPLTISSSQAFPNSPNSRRLLSPRLTLQPPRSSCAAIKAHPPSTALIHWPVLTPAKHASRLPPK